MVANVNSFDLASEDIATAGPPEAISGWSGQLDVGG